MSEPRTDLRLPWHRETIGHANIEEIAAQVARDLAVPLPDGIPANTDATWIVNADNKIVAFVGNGPRQTENADYIIAADCWCGPKVEYVGPDDAVLAECRAALIASETALTAAQNDASTGRALLRNLLDAAAEWALDGGVNAEWEEQDIVRDAERFLAYPDATKRPLNCCGSTEGHLPTCEAVTPDTTRPAEPHPDAGKECCGIEPKHTVEQHYDASRPDTARPVEPPDYSTFTGQDDWPCLCGHRKDKHYFGDARGQDGTFGTWCQLAPKHCESFRPGPFTYDELQQMGYPV